MPTACSRPTHCSAWSRRSPIPASVQSQAISDMSRRTAKAARAQLLGHGPRLAVAREPRRQRHVGHRTALRGAAGDLPPVPDGGRTILSVDRGDRRRAASVVRAARGGVGSARRRSGGGVPAQGASHRPRLRELLAPPGPARSRRTGFYAAQLLTHKVCAVGGACRSWRSPSRRRCRCGHPFYRRRPSSSSCFTDSRSRGSRCGGAASRARPCSRFRSHSMRPISPGFAFARFLRATLNSAGCPTGERRARSTPRRPRRRRRTRNRGIVIFAGCSRGWRGSPIALERPAPDFAALDLSSSLAQPGYRMVWPSSVHVGGAGHVAVRRRPLSRHRRARRTRLAVGCVPARAVRRDLQVDRCSTPQTRSARPKR